MAQCSRSVVVVRVRPVANRHDAKCGAARLPLPEGRDFRRSTNSGFGRIFLHSSAAERSAVNRCVPGSNPGGGACMTGPLGPPAPVTQMARVSRLHREGRGFESLREHRTWRKKPYLLRRLCNTRTCFETRGESENKMVSSSTHSSSNAGRSFSPAPRQRRGQHLLEDAHGGRGRMAIAPACGAGFRGFNSRRSPEPDIASGV